MKFPNWKDIVTVLGVSAGATAMYAANAEDDKPVPASKATLSDDEIMDGADRRAIDSKDLDLQINKLEKEINEGYAPKEAPEASTGGKGNFASHTKKGGGSGKGGQGGSSPTQGR